jgi:hypothetical protein
VRTQDEIVKRIGILTACIGANQDRLYDLALQNKQRKVIFEIHEIDKKTMRLYSELRVLEWVLGEKNVKEGI